MKIVIFDASMLLPSPILLKLLKFIPYTLRLHLL